MILISATIAAATTTVIMTEIIIVVTVVGEVVIIIIIQNNNESNNNMKNNYNNRNNNSTNNSNKVKTITSGNIDVPNYPNQGCWNQRLGCCGLVISVKGRENNPFPVVLLHGKNFLGASQSLEPGQHCQA